LLTSHAAVVFGIVVQQGKFRIVDSGELRGILIVDRPKLLCLNIAQVHILSNDLLLLGPYIFAQKFDEVVRVWLGGVVCVELLVASFLADDEF
jgi:hypothetical protein